MTPREASAAIDALFTVHQTPGYVLSFENQYGKETGDHGLDLDRAPCGDKYVVVTSVGLLDKTTRSPAALFGSVPLAMRWLVDEIKDYAETVEPDRSRWHALHLYWRDQPKFTSTDYIAMDQSGLVQTRSIMTSFMATTLGVAHARLLISKMDPDGKE